MIDYTKIAAIPTRYAGVEFRSRLEAKWACFFDLAGWEWEYEPIDLQGWLPDFWVKWPCGHSECGAHHTLYVEVKPVDDYNVRSEFKSHRCGAHEYLYGGDLGVCATAMFGKRPSSTFWEMAHGAGGGVDTVLNWVENPGALWKEAGNRVQWKPKKR